MRLLSGRRMAHEGGKHKNNTNDTSKHKNDAK